MHGPGFSASPEPLRGAAAAFGEEVAEAASFPNALEAFQERRIIPKAQGYPASILQGQKTLFEALHGPGDGDTSANSVHPQFVAERRGTYHGVRVGHTDKGAK